MSPLTGRSCLNVKICRFSYLYMEYFGTYGWKKQTIWRIHHILQIIGLLWYAICRVSYKLGTLNDSLKLVTLMLKLCGCLHASQRRTVNLNYSGLKSKQPKILLQENYIYHWIVIDCVPNCLWTPIKSADANSKKKKEKVTPASPVKWKPFQVTMSWSSLREGQGFAAQSKAKQSKAKQSKAKGGYLRNLKYETY